MGGFGDAVPTRRERTCSSQTTADGLGHFGMPNQKGCNFTKMIKATRNSKATSIPPTNTGRPGLEGSHPPAEAAPILVFCVHRSQPRARGAYPPAETYIPRGEPRPRMVLLENPPESPCFGCGPRHPRGLHLAFERLTAADGIDEIVCECTPQADEIGWPGLMHTGLLFLVTMETSYWAALTLGGRVHTMTGPATYEPLRLPRVGRTFQVRARLDGYAGENLRVHAVAEDANGRPHATLTSAWRRASRAAATKAGLALPEYLLEDMDP